MCQDLFVTLPCSLLRTLVFTNQVLHSFSDPVKITYKCPVILAENKLRQKGLKVNQVFLNINIKTVILISLKTWVSHVRR